MVLVNDFLALYMKYFNDICRQNYSSMKTELEKILSVSGKSGIFKLITGGRATIIVESLIDGKRLPVHPTQKVSSLSDITMFTYEEDVPLRSVLENAKNVFEGKMGPSHKAEGKEIRKAMEQVLPEYDKERVYESDLRKFFQWYNLLSEKNMLDFEEAADAPMESVGEE